MTQQRLAEIRARLAGPRHPLDLGYLYAQDVGELVEELLWVRINADEARSLLATAEQEMARRVAAEREACAKEVLEGLGHMIPVPDGADVKSFAQGLARGVELAAARILERK